MNWEDLGALLRKWRAAIREKGLLDWFLYEDEKEGLEGEPARAKYCLKLVAIYSFPAVILWGTIGLENKPWSFLTAAAVTVALFVGIPGILLFAYHAITVGITRLPKQIQGVAQIALGVILWLAPVGLFLPANVDITITELLLSFAQGLTSWELWFLELIYVNFVYGVAVSVPPKFLPVRSYLVLTPIIFIAAVVRFQPGSSDHQITTASFYLWHIALGYGAIFAASLVRKIRARREECSTKRGKSVDKGPEDNSRYDQKE